MLAAATLAAVSIAIFLDSLAGGLEFITAATAIVGTLNSGTQVDADRAAAHRPPSIDEKLLRISPSAFPFMQILAKMNRSEEVIQIIHQWPEISRLPRFVVVDDSGGTTAGSAAATVTVTVDSTNAIGPGDILAAPANSADPTFKYIVESVPSSTTIEIFALPQDTTGTSPRTAVAFGTVPSLDDNLEMYWIGNSKSEADAVSTAKGQSPAYQFNYVQTIDHRIEMSDHAQRFANYGPADWDRAMQEQAFEFRKSREYAIVFSEEASVTSKVNLRGETRLYHTMTGLQGMLNSSSTLPTAATESDIVDMIYTSFSDNSGTRRKLLIGGSTFLKSIDKVNASTSTLNVTRGEVVAGVFISRLTGRVGELITAFHPGFDENGRADEALVLDMNKISRGVLQEVELRGMDLKNSSEGVDADAQYLIVKETLVVRGLGDSNGLNSHHIKFSLA